MLFELPRLRTVPLPDELLLLLRWRTVPLFRLLLLLLLRCTEPLLFLLLEDRFTVLLLLLVVDLLRTVPLELPRDRTELPVLLTLLRVVVRSICRLLTLLLILDRASVRVVRILDLLASARVLPEERSPEDLNPEERTWLLRTAFEDVDAM